MWIAVTTSWGFDLVYEAGSAGGSERGGLKPAFDYRHYRTTPSKPAAREALPISPKTELPGIHGPPPKPAVFPLQDTFRATELSCACETAYRGCRDRIRRTVRRWSRRRARWRCGSRSARTRDRQMDNTHSKFLPQ
jgi:hypothetical protein